ncbi:MAG: SGNH/GDSL hydrolase family protein [Bacteroidaceae bacterium]|nr:SGNH/GDSL hydrolase family protein [Bacteroidaceae bacterium]
MRSYYKFHYLFYITFLFTVFIQIGCDDKLEYDKLSLLDDYSTFITNATDDSIFRYATTACPYSINYGKSVGVFGGSISSYSECEIAKGLWAKYLNLNIKTYGKPGHGFSIHQGSIQDQVNDAQKHDIYILWASTNDLQFNHPIGEETDFTIYDKFDSQKRTTQCGGINYCIKKLREKNPECRIYLFTSLKFFTTSEIGYQRKVITDNSEPTATLFDYIEKQIACAQLQGIPYFNQWEAQENRITPHNFQTFYKEDGFHLTTAGYFDIGIRQLLFLAQTTE